MWHRGVCQRRTSDAGHRAAQQLRAERTHDFRSRGVCVCSSPPVCPRVAVVMAKAANDNRALANILPEPFPPHVFSHPSQTYVMHSLGFQYSLLYHTLLFDRSRTARAEPREWDTEAGDTTKCNILNSRQWSTRCRCPLWAPLQGRRSRPVQDR